MGWGVWLLIIVIICVDVSIFFTSIVEVFFQKKAGQKDVKYKKGGIFLFCIITIYLLVFLVLKIIGKMPDL